MNELTEESIAIHLVGIGSSAGGLRALKELLGALKPDGNTAYVVAQHLSPSHASMMVDLLARDTVLSVRELTQRIVPLPDTVYITPPNADAVLRDGQLVLSQPQDVVAAKPSIDMLFNSLADEMHDKAMGIVLSGTGSDGAAGLAMIKNAGGFTLVQAPDSAEYDGMPRSAISTGCADIVDTPENLAAQIPSLINHVEGLSRDQNAISDAQIEEILTEVERKREIDLKGYRRSTQGRRIRRRMLLTDTGSIAEYLHHLRTHDHEVDELLKDLFIPVTAFFRDKDAFHALREQMHDYIGRHYSSGQEINFRVWVAGCSTGEEPYSIAIVLFEIFRELGISPSFKIFATDISSASIEKARAGCYQDETLADLPEGFRQRYFLERQDGCQVKPFLRDAIVFSVHNMIKDPPFSKVDLLVCRNVVIYFSEALQQLVYGNFSYTLKPEGMLFLGASESPGGNKYFSELNRSFRIYERRNLPGQLRWSYPRNSGASTHISAVSSARQEAVKYNAIDALAFKWLSSIYAPPTILIDQADKTLFLHNDAQRFLDIGEGIFTGGLFDIVQSEMRPTLRALVHRARKLDSDQKHSITVSHRGDVLNRFRIEANKVPEIHEGWLLLSFIEDNIERPKSSSMVSEASSGDATLEELENELRATRLDLQVVSEQLQTANEELQSSNEELQATNEELQATNEELQTANEELQSSNEELRTLNEEVVLKNTELELLSLDLTTIENSLDIPLLILDEETRVRRYSPALVSVTNSDSVKIGDPLRAIKFKSPLPADLIEKIENISTTENQLKHRFEFSNSVFELRVLPYQINSSEKVNSILSFYDLSNFYQYQRHLVGELDKLHEVFSSLGEAIVRCDLNGIVDFANAEAALLFGLIREQIRGMKISDVCRLYASPDVKEMLPMLDHLSEYASSDTQFPYNGYLKIAGADEPTRLDFSIVPLNNVNGDVVGYAIAFKDLTESELLIKQLNSQKDELIDQQRDILNNERKLRTIVDQSLDALIGIDKKGTILLVNPMVERMFGYSSDELIGENIRILMPEPYRSEHDAYLRNHLEGRGYKVIGSPRELTAVDKHGREFPILLRVGEVPSEDAVPLEQGIISYVGSVQDITQIKLQEERLRQSQKLEAVGGMVGGIAHDFNNIVGIISGNLELIGLEEGLSSDVTESLHSAQKASKRAADLTRKLLKFSRSMPQSQSNVDCDASISELKLILERSLPPGIDLQCELGAKGVHVLVDEGDLEDALLNLVINARDAIGESGRIALSTRLISAKEEFINIQSDMFDPKREYLMISLQDNGEGIPEENKNKLFDPFFSTKDAEKGSGLGLSMVYGFCKRSKGWVDLESQVGMGTTIRLFLPVSDSELDTKSLSKKGPLPMSRKGETILLVDDEGDLLDVLRRFLLFLGYHVVAYTNASKALQHIETQADTIDLVLSDLVMPGPLNGVELFERARECRSGLPCIAISGFIGDLRIPEDIRLIKKPFDKDDIAVVVYDALGDE